MVCKQIHLKTSWIACVLTFLKCMHSCNTCLLYCGHICILFTLTVCCYTFKVLAMLGVPPFLQIVATDITYERMWFECDCNGQLPVCVIRLICVLCFYVFWYEHTASNILRHSISFGWSDNWHNLAMFVHFNLSLTLFIHLQIKCVKSGCLTSWCRLPQHFHIEPDLILSL